MYIKKIHKKKQQQKEKKKGRYFECKRFYYFLLLYGSFSIVTWKSDSQLPPSQDNDILQSEEISFLLLFLHGETLHQITIKESLKNPIPFFFFFFVTTKAFSALHKCIKNQKENNNATQVAAIQRNQAFAVQRNQTLLPSMSDLFLEVCLIRFYWLEGTFRFSSTRLFFFHLFFFQESSGML